MSKELITIDEMWKILKNENPKMKVTIENAEKVVKLNNSYENFIIKQKDQRIAELETNLRETIDMVKNSNYKEVLEENISLSNSLNTSVELNKKHRERIAELEKQVAIREIAFLNEIPHWDYYYDWEKFEDEERQLYIKKRFEQAEEALKKAEGENERI